MALKFMPRGWLLSEGISASHVQQLSALELHLEGEGKLLGVLQCLLWAWHSLGSVLKHQRESHDQTAVSSYHVFFCCWGERAWPKQLIKECLTGFLVQRVKFSSWYRAKAWRQEELRADVSSSSQRQRELTLKGRSLLKSQSPPPMTPPPISHTS